MCHVIQIEFTVAMDFPLNDAFSRRSGSQPVLRTAARVLRNQVFSARPVNRFGHSVPISARDLENGDFSQKIHLGMILPLT